MADWIRNTVMLTVLVVWAVYVIAAVARGEVSDIDPVVWGAPTAMYFALAPTWKKGSKDGPG